MATSKQETNPAKNRTTLDNQDTSGVKPNQSLSLKNIKCYLKRKKRGEKGQCCSFFALFTVQFSPTAAGVYDVGVRKNMGKVNDSFF